MNAGFIGMTVIYVHSGITEAKAAYAELTLSKHLKANVSEEQTIYLKYEFTKTEIEIVKLAISGYTSKKIADILHRSENTVNKHIQNIFRKAGVNSRARLIEKLNVKPNTP
jgi:DNA-binding CsgD family transcriptional regulator